MRVVDRGVDLQQLVGGVALEPVVDDPGDLAAVRRRGWTPPRPGWRRSSAAPACSRAAWPRRSRSASSAAWLQRVDHLRQDRRGVAFGRQLVGGREEVALRVALGVRRQAELDGLREHLVVLLREKSVFLASVATIWSTREPLGDRDHRAHPVGRVDQHRERGGRRTSASSAGRSRPGCRRDRVSWRAASVKACTDFTTSLSFSVAAMSAAASPVLDLDEHLAGAAAGVVLAGRQSLSLSAVIP